MICKNGGEGFHSFYIHTLKTTMEICHQKCETISLIIQINLGFGNFDFEFEFGEMKVTVCDMTTTTQGVGHRFF